MEKGYRSSEFWLSAVVSVLGLVGTLGLVTPSEADTLSKAVTEIFGGFAAIYATVRYIRSRTELKVAAMQIGAAQK